ncbi:hypothetical protein ACIRBX_03795 [Kitasatospora sp. NPDC096147]|uniref:hypothetical protein n=1 Tax=Kitasatospora sp. NPDC096147 TaxID=3364093 RepID=UPI0037F503F2
MTEPLPYRPLTVEAAAALQRTLRADLGPGLSDSELDAVEARFGFRFAADHRMFLAAGLPHGTPWWPDWRHGDPDTLRAWLAPPVEGVLSDVEHNGFWYPASWGPRPDSPSAALDAARTHLATVPPLVPIQGHRYLPAVAGQSGHPVLSVHRTDVITYGNDLADHIRYESTGRRWEHSRPRPSAAFWTYLVEGREPVFVTPYAPADLTPEAVLDHLRMLAVERLIGRHLHADHLVQAATAAHRATLRTPALTRLATLPPAAFHTAGTLFDQALTELGLTATLPADDTDLPGEAARWELVRLRASRP